MKKKKFTIRAFPIVFVGKEPYITEAKLKDDEDFEL